MALIARIGAPVIGALGRTWRYSSEGAEGFDRCIAAGQWPILALWHGRILPATPFWRDRGVVAITSENFDGEWIARIMARFGYGAVRGSTSRGGVKALVQLKRLVGQGHPTAFTVDGPRGPSRRAQPGVLWLAKVTGQPILPFHIEAASAWYLGSWDRALVPRPFTRVTVAVGPPFLVAMDADDAALERRRLDLEVELGRLQQRATAMLQPRQG